MPLQFPSIGDLPHGLSGFLLKVVNAVNALENEVRGSLSIERQLRGRTDAAARGLLERIASERQAAAEAQAGLRTQLDEATAARVAASEAAGLREAGIDAAITAALQFPLVVGGDPLRVLTEGEWTMAPGSSEVTIAAPPSGIEFYMDVRGARVTAAEGMEGLLRFRNVEGRVVGGAPVLGTSARENSFAVGLDYGLNTYVLEGRVSRAAPARESDGLIVGSATLRVRVS